MLKKWAIALLLSWVRGLADAIVTADARDYPTLAERKAAVDAAIDAQKDAPGTLRGIIRKQLAGIKDATAYEAAVAMVLAVLDNLVT